MQIIRIIFAIIDYILFFINIRYVATRDVMRTKIVYFIWSVFLLFAALYFTIGFFVEMG